MLQLKKTLVEGDIAHSAITELDYASAGHTGFEPTVTKGNLTAGSSKITIGGTGTGAVIGAGATVDVDESNLVIANMSDEAVADWNTAYTHVSNDGSDHSFIDQSVVSGATPTFTGTNITGVPAASVVAGTFGVGDYVVDGALTVNEGAIFNEDGNNHDFRIESLDRDEIFFVDASTNRIHMNFEGSALTGVSNFNLYGDSPKISMIDGTNLVHYSFGSAGGIFQVTQTTNTGTITGAGQFFAMDTARVIINRSRVNIDFTVYGDTTTDLIYLDAGTEVITLGGRTNGVSFAKDGNLSFLGTAGFYPRTLSQDAEPAAGTGATAIDSGEMIFWVDTNDSNRRYQMYNHGGTVVKVELT